MRRAALLLLLAAAALAGMSSLKVMPGVREAGMGDAGVAGAAGAFGIAWNPAAAADVRGFAASASYAKWLLDSHQQSLFLVRDFSLFRAGFGVTGFTAGAFEYRSDVPTEEPLGDFVPGEFSFRVTVARRFGIVDAGISARYYYSKVMADAANGPGVDAGVRVAPVEGLAFGASLTDFGRNLVYYYESFRLPTRARAGAVYRLPLGGRNRLELAGEGGYYVYTKTFNVHGGAEFLWNELLALRAGCEWLDGPVRPGFGLGLLAGRLRFDYSFTLLNDDLGAAHRFALGLGG